LNPTHDRVLQLNYHARVDCLCVSPVTNNINDDHNEPCSREVCDIVRVPVAKLKHIIILNLRTAAFKAYCAIWVRRSNFRHQASPRVSPRESTQRWKVELWARNVWEFCLNVDFHVTFRDLLHAVKLRHGTDGFTSPPKEGVLRIFFDLKIRRIWPGALLLDHRSR
jgi:hypothetical protein